MYIIVIGFDRYLSWIGISSGKSVDFGTSDRKADAALFDERSVAEAIEALVDGRATASELFTSGISPASRG